MSDWVLILAIAGAWALIGRRFLIWAAPKSLESSPNLLRRMGDHPVAIHTTRERPTMPWETDPRDSEVVVGLPNRSLTVTMRERNAGPFWYCAGDDIADHHAGRCKCIPVATAAKIAAAGMSLFPRR